MVEIMESSGGYEDHDGVRRVIAIGGTTAEERGLLQRKKDREKECSVWPNLQRIDK